MVPDALEIQNFANSIFIINLTLFCFQVRSVWTFGILETQSILGSEPGCLGGNPGGDPGANQGQAVLGV